MNRLGGDFVSKVDFAANLGKNYNRKNSAIVFAREYWRGIARPHATRTLTRLPDTERSVIEKLGEAMPFDGVFPVLLIEDDDTSAFNKYKRTMLLMYFVDSNVEEMTADDMKSKWRALLRDKDVVSQATFIKYKPFNIRKVNSLSQIIPSFIKWI